MKKYSWILFSLASLVAVCTFSASTTLHASTIVVYSSTTDQAYAYPTTPPTTAELTALEDDNTTGLTFSTNLLSVYTNTYTVGGVYFGRVTDIPAAIASEIQQVSLGGTGTVQKSGFVETTFVLPTGATDVSMTGQFSADETGYVYLNGHFIGEAGSITSGKTSNNPNDITFSSSDMAYFNVGGTNTLVFSDINQNTVSGMEFYDTITYTPLAVAATPEPSTTLLLGSGLLVLAGIVRRKRVVRA